MQTAFRRIASVAALAALVPLCSVAAARPAEAFQVGPSPDYPGCSVWLNDQGQPLRNRSGREIGRKVPCAGGGHNRDVYEVLPGEAEGTLVIRDASHHVECILALAPGSTTVLTQKACQGWDGG